jgi:hypothetical protein
MPLRFAATGAPSIVVAKFLTDLSAEARFLLNVCPHPNSEFENPLKFLSVVMPSIIVAERMGRKIVV